MPEDILVTLLSDGPASVCSHQQLGKHFTRDMPCVNSCTIYDWPNVTRGKVNAFELRGFENPVSANQSEQKAFVLGRAN